MINAEAMFPWRFILPVFYSQVIPQKFRWFVYIWYNEEINKNVKPLPSGVQYFIPSPSSKFWKINAPVIYFFYIGELTEYYLLSMLQTKAICRKNLNLQSVPRGVEGQLHQSLVRTTVSSFSRPNHIEILVLSILFFLKCPILENNYIF